MPSHRCLLVLHLPRIKALAKTIGYYDWGKSLDSRYSPEKGSGEMEKELSRRSFLAGAGLLGATMGFGLAGCSSAEPAASAAGDDTLATTGEDAAPGIEWAKEADVVVLGYGAAGAATAIEAADNGASVLIVEKEALPGGSMARCGGAIMGAGTRVQKELGYEDAADDMYEDRKSVV